MTQPDWDDDRLDAAFHTRFDRPAPTGLTHDVHVRIAGSSPARFSGLRAGRAWSLAAAAVVVVLVAGTAFVGFGGLGRTGGSPPPSDASASGAVPSATPTLQALASEYLGLPVLDVPDSIAIRDSGVDDREIAVAGWFTPGTRDYRCAAPSPEDPSLLEPNCGDESLWLTRDAESLVHRSGNVLTGTDPQGPAIRPWLQFLDSSWQPTDLGIDANGDSVPTDVVFIGHFDDRRAALCPETSRAACEDRFVVDSVAAVRGVPRDRSELNAGNATSRVADIEAIVANEAPDSPILSLSVMLYPDDLTATEPSLQSGPQVLRDHPILWIVRVLESERAVTYIVIDGSDAIYEMNPAGEAILVGGEPPQPSRPSAPASAWPPAGARTIALTSEVGAGQAPVQVAVVDHSGRLSGVSEKGTIDPSTRTLDQRIEAYPELDVLPGRVHLAWVGSICDSRITVTVAQDVKTITFDMGPVVDCDSIGIGRELVLDFSGLLDVPSIDLVDGTGMPPPDATGYSIDCGVMEHDACLAKAAGIAAATPEKQMARIVFTGECGSYTATYKDGTGVSASIDCIPQP